MQLAQHLIETEMEWLLFHLSSRRPKVSPKCFTFTVAETLVLRHGIPAALYYTDTIGAIRVKTKPENLHPAAIFKCFVTEGDQRSKEDTAPGATAMSYIYHNEVKKVAVSVGYHEAGRFFNMLKDCGKQCYEGYRPNLF